MKAASRAASEPDRKQVALVFGVFTGCQNERAAEVEPPGCRSEQPGEVALCAATPDQPINAIAHRTRQFVLQLARFVTAERQIGQVVSLHRDPHPETGGEMRQVLQRCRRPRQLNARMAIEQGPQGPPVLAGRPAGHEDAPHVARADGSLRARSDRPTGQTSPSQRRWSQNRHTVLAVAASSPAL